LKKYFINIYQKVLKNKILIQNFSYLSALQVFNMLVPLITLPYLLKVLGKETYGLIVFAQAVVSYLAIFVEFGFNTLATKEISINRANQIKLNEISSTVLTLKAILFILSLFVLTISLFFIKQAKGFEILLYLSMWVCFYDVLFPIWFFQGIEKMKYITFLTVISRTVFLFSIFVFVKSQEQYLRVPAINGIGALISGTLGLFIMFKNQKVSYTIPTITQLKNFTKKALPFFVSNISVKIFASSNKIILGSVLGMAEVAYYDFAEKIINVFRSVPLSIVRNTIYPKVAKTKNMEIVKMTTIVMTIFSLISILFINIFATKIITLLGGEEMLSSLHIIQLFSIIILTTHLSNYYITVGLWSLGYENVFRNLMIYSSLLFLFIYAILWILKLINIYTITLTPIIVDIYLVIHIFLFWKTINIKKNESKH